MRNIDRIRQMSLEELAPYFVHDKTVRDWEDEFMAYVSPSGRQHVSYEEALKDCIDWLNSEQSTSLKNIDEYFDGLTISNTNKFLLDKKGGEK